MMHPTIHQWSYVAAGTGTWPLILACFVCGVLTGGALGADGTALTMDQLKAQRKQLAQQQRRIIYNNDGDGIGLIQAPATKDAFLAIRTTAVAGTHTDAIWYYSTWGIKLHHSDGPFGQLYGCPDTWENRASTKNTMALIEQTGKDNLDIMIDFCQQHGLASRRRAGRNHRCT